VSETQVLALAATKTTFEEQSDIGEFITHRFKGPADCVLPMSVFAGVDDRLRLATANGVNSTEIVPASALSNEDEAYEVAGMSVIRLSQIVKLIKVMQIPLHSLLNNSAFQQSEFGKLLCVH
jgi:hypothetical protein